MDHNQHAYKKIHSCETALLTLLNDTYMAIDNGMVMQLVLLDFTAAFDVVDHGLLLRKCMSLGICDSAHQWVKNYLINREQFVSCFDHNSEVSVLKPGVPQGVPSSDHSFLLYFSLIYLPCMLPTQPNTFFMQMMCRSSFHLQYMKLTSSLLSSTQKKFIDAPIELSNIL